jgi:putative flippase GtrA
MSREPPRTQGLRHWVGFLVSGGLAFLIDALALTALTVWLGVPVLLARLVAISLAMVAAWLSHRRLTFALETAPTLTEFIAYAGVAWAAAAVNYGVFVLIILAAPALWPLIALVASSAVAMVAAYLGMRFKVFRRR